MPKRTPKVENKGWLSPAQGWPRRSPCRYIRLCVDFRRGTPIPYENLPTVFAKLTARFGDHEVTVTVPKLKPEAWASDLPWKQSAHSASLTIPLIKLEDSSTWNRLLAMSEWGNVSVHAMRGGGASRHAVWALSRESSSYSVEGLNLYCDTRHISSTHQALSHADALVLEFFSALCLTDNAIGGYGECISHGQVNRVGMWQHDVGSDSWLAGGLIHSDYEAALPTVPGPRWLTVLLPHHVKAMGGKRDLNERALRFERDMHPERDFTTARWQKNREIKLSDIAGGVMVWGAPIKEVIEVNIWSSPRLCLPLSITWLLQELAAAGLLSHARTDRLEATRAEVKRRMAEFDARAKQAEHPATEPTAASLTIEDVRSMTATRPPRCVLRGEFGSPPKHAVPDNCICMRILPKQADDGLTVYSGLVDPEGAQAVLAGSLNPQRAALYFDSRIHGYDGEHAPQSPESARPIPRLKQIVCPKCHGRHFQVFAEFEYPDDLSAQDGLHPQDLFAWFKVFVKCLYCRWSDTVAEVECA